MKRVPLCLALLLALSAAAAAQPAHHAGPEAAAPAAHAEPEHAPGLPADVTTQHTLETAGHTLHFTATAGSLRLTDDEGKPRTTLAFIGYQGDGADPATRPVTFLFNGGPGMASGWLQVGAVGPWRIELGGDAGVPSASAIPQPNPDTWLDFTDLVFIDPPGTGYSRIDSTDRDVRRQLWSVNGDISVLAEAIRRWLDRNDRNVSPKYIVGESYGGFRGPRLIRQLQSEDGVGVKGLVLISPMVDAHAESQDYDPFGWVYRLPSEVAAARALKGPVTRASVADAEKYAATDYVEDLLRGEHDQAAVARMSEHVAALTGLDPALLRRFHGRLDADEFLRELERAQQKVGSIYDPTIARGDPFPRRAFTYYPDPVLEGLKAPITSAMVTIYNDKLHWRPDAVYRLSNDAAFNQWDWGRGMGRPESVSAMLWALSLDPQLHVLVAHGLFDLRTPYFGAVLLMRQFSDVAPAGRVRLAVYPGGHMFYTRDASRHALHDDAQAMFRQ